MTATQRNIRTGVVTTLVGTLLLWLVATGWKSFVPRGEYDLHVQSEMYEHQRAATQDSIQTAILMDVRCELQPTRRDCR